MKALTLEEILNISENTNITIEYKNKNYPGYLVKEKTGIYILSNCAELDGLNCSTLTATKFLFSWIIKSERDLENDINKIRLYLGKPLIKKKISNKDRDRVIRKLLLNNACDSSKVYFYEKFFEKEISKITIKQIKKIIDKSQYKSDLITYIDEIPNYTYE